MILYSIQKFWESSYKSDLQVRITFVLSLILNILAWLVLYIKIQPFSYLTATGDIPLHFNVYFGIDIYGKWYQVFILPLFGLLIIILNNIVGYMLFARERLLTLFMVWSQLVLNFILFAASVFIVLLNI